jgi:hypothetical protein
MKKIFKMFFLLMLVAALFGGFDVLVSQDTASSTSSGVTSIQLGVVSPVAAETGACEDGKPGC